MHTRALARVRRQTERQLAEDLGKLRGVAADLSSLGAAPWVQALDTDEAHAHQSEAVAAAAAAAAALSQLHFGADHAGLASVALLVAEQALERPPLDKATLAALAGDVQAHLPKVR